MRLQLPTATTTTTSSLLAAPRHTAPCPSRRGAFTPSTDAAAWDAGRTLHHHGSPTHDTWSGCEGDDVVDDVVSVSSSSHVGSPQRAHTLGMASPSSELSLAPPYDSAMGEELAWMACERELDEEKMPRQRGMGRYRRLGSPNSPSYLPHEGTQPYPLSDAGDGSQDDAMNRNGSTSAKQTVATPPSPSSPSPPTDTTTTNNATTHRHVHAASADVALASHRRSHPTCLPLVRLTVEHIYKQERSCTNTTVVGASATRHCIQQGGRGALINVCFPDNSCHNTSQPVDAQSEVEDENDDDDDDDQDHVEEVAYRREERTSSEVVVADTTATLATTTTTTTTTTSPEAVCEPRHPRSTHSHPCAVRSSLWSSCCRLLRLLNVMMAAFILLGCAIEFVVFSPTTTTMMMAS